MVSLHTTIAMIRTVTIDIINEKALNLLKDLELMKLIRLRQEKTETDKPVDWQAKYKGAMTKEPLDQVDEQLNELRNDWE